MMLMIHPVSEQTVRPYVGLPVVVALSDGSRYFGTLSRVNQKRVILNDAPQFETTQSKKAKRFTAKSAKTKKAKAARIRHQPDGGLGAWPIAPLPAAANPFTQRFALPLSAIEFITTWI